ncbi:hypothetical protein [Salinivibrio phage CW02]|uniref:Uncharacterized protein n=1 Tax=Salinivibrio phage CW02 TaxID=1161935 RepID=H9D1I4_9CAUD|nr:hypothetical protein F490_gp11 [Salinivibrio phage CW02]AFE86226.1 hypothetical protein [Salinivibrio phage CW02]
MVKEGDLVEVVYLPKMMQHFPVSVGVVVSHSGEDFFINQVDKRGRMIKGASCGWYDRGNVKTLAPQYKRGTLDGKVIYRDVDNLEEILSDAFSRTKLLGARYKKEFSKYIDSVLNT